MRTKSSGLRAGLKLARTGLSRALGPLERRRLQRVGPTGPEEPPLFLIGAPRSGTTLLYQLCVQRFELAYFPWLSNVLPEAAVTAACLARRLYPPYRSDFSSRYGRSHGGRAPHEAGQVWHRWFPDSGDTGHYTSAGELSDDARDELRQTVAAMNRAFGVPFINKNVLHSVRIRALADVFPKALFVWIRRNSLDAAASILRARRKIGVPSDGWWSVMPKQIDQLRGLSVPEQVSGQVYCVEQIIAEDLNAIGTGRSLEIDYLQMCEAPKTCVTHIEEFVGEHGAALQAKDEVPERFEPSHASATLDDADRMALEAALASYADDRDRARPGEDRL